MSVTADSWEEKEKLEQFKENLPPGTQGSSKETRQDLHPS